MRKQWQPTHAIAQISDTHLSDDSPADSTTESAVERLRAVVTAIVRSDIPIAALLVTGDVADHGRPAEYDMFAATIKSLSFPTLVLPGNHDDPGTMRNHLAGVAAVCDAGAVAELRHDELTIIGVDTTVPGEEGGGVTATTVAALRAALARTSTAIVATHHPPFPIGDPYLDDIGLHDPDNSFSRVVSDHNDRVIAVVSGHVHRPASTIWNGVHGVTAPSTIRRPIAVPSNTPLRLRRPVPDTAGYALHLVTGVACVTHFIAVR